MNAYAQSGKTFEEIVSRVNDKFDAIKTMTANIVRVSSKGKQSVEERWVYYFKSPDKLRIEYLKPNKRFLILNGDKFIEYIPELSRAQVIDLSKYDDKKKAEFYENVFFRVSILGLRLGKIPKGKIAIKSVSFDEFDAYLVESDEPKYQFWVDAKTGALLKHVIFDDNGEIVYLTTGIDFKRFGDDYLLPVRMKVILPEISAKGKMTTSDVELNQLEINKDISDSLFDFEIPQGVEINNF